MLGAATPNIIIAYNLIFNKRLFPITIGKF